MNNKQPFTIDGRGVYMTLGGLLVFLCFLIWGCYQSQKPKPESAIPAITEVQRDMGRTTDQLDTSTGVVAVSVEEIRKDPASVKPTIAKPLNTIDAQVGIFHFLSGNYRLLEGDLEGVKARCLKQEQYIGWQAKEIDLRDQKYDKLENSWAVWIGRKILWIVSIWGIALLAVGVFKFIGLLNVGGLGTIFSMIGSTIGGIVPFGGFMTTIADNVYFRNIKPFVPQARNS